MLKLSFNLLALVVFLSLVSFASFWPLNLIQFESRLPSSGFVLGAATQKNLSVNVQHHDQSDELTVEALAFRNQRTVYHNVSAVNNSSSRPLLFSITSSSLTEGSPSVDGYDIYFTAGSKILREVTLAPGGQAFLNVEISGKDSGPASFKVGLTFNIKSY